MLIGNGNRLYGTPGNFRGAGIAASRDNYGDPGSLRNIWSGQGEFDPTVAYIIILPPGVTSAGSIVLGASSIATESSLVATLLRLADMSSPITTSSTVFSSLVGLTVGVSAISTSSVFTSAAFLIASSSSSLVTDSIFISVLSGRANTSSSLITNSTVAGAAFAISSGASAMQTFSVFTSDAKLYVFSESNIAGSSILSAAIMGVSQAASDISTLSILDGISVLISKAQISIVTSSFLFTSAIATYSMSAAINSGVDPQTLANAVWHGTPIEGAYTAAEVLRLIASVLAGKSIISGSNTSFRDINDTVTRVSATVVAGERTTMTLDANGVGVGAGSTIADAVWLRQIEGIYTAEDLMRLISAALVGKTSIIQGIPGSATVTFRDINDTRNRIVANMTGSERTTITKDVID